MTESEALQPPPSQSGTREGLGAWSEERVASLSRADGPPCPTERLRLDALPDLLRVDEVAELFRMSPAAIRQRICRGQLAALKLGPPPKNLASRDRRAVRICRRSVLEFLGLPVDSPGVQSAVPSFSRRRRQGGEGWRS